MPGFQGNSLVRAHQQEQLRSRSFSLQFTQCVDGVGGARTLQLTPIHVHTGYASKGQFGHGQPVGGRCQCSAFMPGVACGKHPEFVQLQLVHGRLHQHTMGIVWRVKCPAIHTNTALVQAHTHARRTRNWLVSASSGEPDSTVRW